MKIRVDQKTLADAARWGQRHLTETPVMPQLAALHIATAGDRITISGTDLDTTTHASMDAEVLEDGTVLVSGKLLADITAALPAGPVDLVADDHQLTATVPGTSYTLPLLDNHNYPVLPAAPTVSGHVDGGELAKAVTHAVAAAMPQKDAVGQVAGMGGIHIATAGMQATVSATNRYVIVQHTLTWTPGGPDSDGTLLIPEPVIKNAVRALAEGPANLHLPAGDSSVAGLSGGDLTLVTRCIAQEFPDITRFNKPDPNAVGTVDFDPAELAAAAKRMALVNDKNRPISLTVQDSQLHISGGHDGRHSTTTINCVIDGDLDGFSIAFNPDYLGIALKPVTGTARMWLTTPTKPGYIRPTDEDDSTYWAVCMPLRMPK
jgi:DNA polymerase-3 subunit beta